MNNFSGSTMRNRRNLLDLNGFAPIHFPVSKYSTDAQTKTEMKHTYSDGLFINNLHLIPDPLKKNLADSVITGEEKNKPKMEVPKEYIAKEAEKPPVNQRADYYPSLSGITSFFSGVLNVMGAMFHKRSNSPISQYYDCYDSGDDQEMASHSPWQSSNIEVQNKNGWARNQLGTNNDSNTNSDVDMSINCRTAVAHCEEKLNQVRLLLGGGANKNNVTSTNSRLRTRRPKKAFVEAGSVNESFEDAFSPEECMSLSNDPYIEFCSPFNYHDEELVEALGPKIKTELHVKESMDIVKDIPENNVKDVSEPSITTNNEVVSSCEDKLSKLKALLQSKRNKTKELLVEIDSGLDSTKPIPIPNQNNIVKPTETGKETVFADEINATELQNSSQSSQEPDCFNEVTGKFYSSSVDSEDSFQIVFTDSPQRCMRRIPSDCESEDSFIVFEESPDSCYTSNEVFGEDTIRESQNDTSDSDSDIEDDSGCGVTCKLAHNLSRTFGDLTDDSLYSQDVVDCAVRVVDEIPNEDVTDGETEKVGLLLNERRKLEKKKQPPKKVRFSDKPPKVHVMRVWAYAARQARAGHWERHALDRERFRRRIADVEMAISWVLKPQHRSRVMFQRFRPWWNAQKRKELAEKKEREQSEKEEELRRLEAEKETGNHADVDEKVDVESSLDFDGSIEESSKENEIIKSNDHKDLDGIKDLNEVSNVITNDSFEVTINGIGNSPDEITIDSDVINGDVNIKNAIYINGCYNKCGKSSDFIIDEKNSTENDERKYANDDQYLHSDT